MYRVCQSEANSARARLRMRKMTTTSFRTSMAVSEFQDGDSVFAKSEGDLGDDESEGEAAVATEKEEKRSKRQPRDITPAEREVHSRWATRNDADHVGNIGWLFGNWGKRPNNVKMRNHFDTVLK